MSTHREAAARVADGGGTLSSTSSRSTGGRRPTPDDVVPRLIGLGMGPDAASWLVQAYPEQQVGDVLDAFEELELRRPVRDPVGWVDAAVRQRWDVSDLLARRRQREVRLAAHDTEQQERDRARDAWPRGRAVSDRWDATISAALDDHQLARAIDALTAPVAGVGRRSAPVVRAELIAWAIGVHDRTPHKPLADALADDLDRGPDATGSLQWPLPEPPEADQTGVGEGLGARVASILTARQVAEERTAVLAEAVEVPRHDLAGRDLGR